MEKYSIPVYNLDTKQEDIIQPGSLVLDSHCTVILPKTEENQLFADELNKQYKRDHENLIMNTYKTKETKTDKKYCFYDFEWTYNKDKTESFVYAWSLKCQGEDAVYKFGLNIEEDIVKEIKEYADRN